MNLTTRFSPKSSELGKRIRAVSDKSRKSNGTPIIIFFLLSCVVIGFLFSCNIVTTEPEDTTDSEETTQTEDATEKETDETTASGNFPVLIPPEEIDDEDMIKCFLDHIMQYVERAEEEESYRTGFLSSILTKEQRIAFLKGRFFYNEIILDSGNLIPSELIAGYETGSETIIVYSNMKYVTFCNFINREIACDSAAKFIREGNNVYVNVNPDDRFAVKLQAMGSNAFLHSVEYFIDEASTENEIILIQKNNYMASMTDKNIVCDISDPDCPTVSKEFRHKLRLTENGWRLAKYDVNQYYYPNTAYSAEETTASQPPHTPGPTTFASYAEMKSYLEENGIPYQWAGKDSGDENAVAVRELKGFPEELTVLFIEWGDLYAVNYDRPCVFMPCSSEEKLKEYENSALQYDGTYESLLANKLISNVRKTDLTVSLGMGYECKYDTAKATDCILRSYEYTDAQSHIAYHISELYTDKNEFQSGTLFVFDGENSFAFSYAEPVITMELALGLSSVLAD